MRNIFFNAVFLGLISTSLWSEEKAEFPEVITVPKGLPPIPWPADNPYTPEKAELGRLLYFDKRLSSNETVSCASCHDPRLTYGDRKKVSIGIFGHAGTRHAPTVINSAYSKFQFWDGRANSLEEQCLGPWEIRRK